ncbi:MAG: metallophosphoesterase family protein [Methanothermobacter tenebrarum]|uniref:Serine/threonine protein phosphatase n=2 Tax=Methanothermobacter tenebrarum TaxID=680118 RepID=A0A328PAY7_9EURY|nr:serine/threonine protein phosphatase [Methanobacteriaceae archaeon]RAO79907.1 serine/threonine protein phosphatase [Methanothermobacter tenebrarum]
MYRGGLIEVGGSENLLVVTDLHGNLRDFKTYLKIWEEDYNRGCPIVFTGDFIHSMGYEDGSVEILETLRVYYRRYKNFYLLLGNHEWSHITGIDVFKGGINQSLSFERLLNEKFGDHWMEKLESYKRFFKELPFAVKTENKVFISHAGPSRHIKGIDDMINIKENGYQSPAVYEMLWNRYGSYLEDDIDEFLKRVECNAMIVGHTPVDGYQIIGNQIILSSSYSAGRKAYINLDLKAKIESAQDLIQMIKFIQY